MNLASFLVNHFLRHIVIYYLKSSYIARGVAISNNNGCPEPAPRPGL